MCLVNLVNTGVIQADGDLDFNGALINNSGSIDSTHALYDLQGSFDNSGGIYHAGSVVVDTTDFSNLSASQFVANTLDLDSSSSVNNAGLIYTTDGMTIQTNDLVNQNTRGDNINDFDFGIQASGTLVFDVDSIDNQNGLIVGSGMSIESDLLNNQSGQVVDYGSGIDITATDVTNDNGRFESNGDISIPANLSNNGGMLYGSSGLNLTDVDNTNGQLLANSGQITIDTNQTFLNTNGNVISYDGNINISADNYSNSNGAIVAANNASLAINQDFYTSGLLTANGDLGISAAFVYLNDSLPAGNKLSLNASKGITVQNGNWVYGNGVDFSAGNNITNEGVIESSDSISLESGDAFINQGNINSLGDVAIVGNSNASNTHDFTNSGSILSDGNLTLSYVGDTVVNTGTLFAGENINMSANGLSNSSLIYSNEDSVFNITDYVYNSNQILSLVI